VTTPGRSVPEILEKIGSRATSGHCEKTVQRLQSELIAA
jgi:hypothetical protein